MMNLRTVKVTRYVTPLREGGSLPAIAEADDGSLYVLKFKGAGGGVDLALFFEACADATKVVATIAKVKMVCLIMILNKLR